MIAPRWIRKAVPLFQLDWYYDLLVTTSAQRSEGTRHPLIYTDKRISVLRHGHRIWAQDLRVPDERRGLQSLALTALLSGIAIPTNPVESLSNLFASPPRCRGR